MQHQGALLVRVRPGWAYGIAARTAKPFRKNSWGSSKQLAAPLYASVVAGIDGDGLDGSMECGERTGDPRPAAREVMMSQQGAIARLLSNTAFITACMTAAASLWIVVLSGSVPPHIQLMFWTASQLLSGAWVGCWVMYTALAWSSQQTDALRAGCIMLVGVIPPLAYSCTMEPSQAVLMMLVGLVTYYIRPSLSGKHNVSAVAARPAAQELRRLEQGCQALSCATEVATVMSLIVVFLPALFDAVYGCSSALLDAVLRGHQVMLGIWTLLIAAYTAYAKRFNMVNAYSNSCTVLVLLMLPIAFCCFQQPKLACVLMYAVWLLCVCILRGNEKFYHIRHQQLVDVIQRDLKVEQN